MLTLIVDDPAIVYCEWKGPQYPYLQVPSSMYVEQTMFPNYKSNTITLAFCCSIRIVPSALFYSSPSACSCSISISTPLFLRAHTHPSSSNHLPIYTIAPSTPTAVVVCIMRPRLFISSFLPPLSFTHQIRPDHDDSKGQTLAGWAFWPFRSLEWHQQRRRGRRRGRGRGREGETGAAIRRQADGRQTARKQAGLHR